MEEGFYSGRHRRSRRLDTMASGVAGRSLGLALPLLALTLVASAQLANDEILGVARDIAFDTGAKTEIATPLGPVIGKVVESADGEHKHIQASFGCPTRHSGGRFNSIKKGTEKRPEKGTESQFAKNICMKLFDWVKLH